MNTNNYYTFIVTAIFFLTPNIYRQNLHCKFTEKEFSGSSIFLYEVYGPQLRPVDTTKVNSDGSFHFKTNEYLLGYYRLASSSQNWVDIILNPEEEEVFLSFNNSIDFTQMKVLVSNENKARMEYKTLIEDRFKEESDAMKRLSSLPKENKEAIR